MNEQSNIITLILAIWGAFLSTILSVIGLMKFYYEGVRIKVKVMGNMAMITPNNPKNEEPNILITVCNCGKRTTTITHAWLKTGSNTNLIASDCFFKGPQKLGEGEYTQYIMRESSAKNYGLLSRDYLAVVSDAAGRTFYSHPLPIRWVKLARMRLFRKQKKD